MGGQGDAPRMGRRGRTSLGGVVSPSDCCPLLPQVMMGREFGGVAFMPSPAVALFQDFEVGQVYTQKIAVTNRSYDRNTYRVVQVGSLSEHPYL